MSGQEQIKRQPTDRDADTHEAPVVASDPKVAKLKSDLDDLLDEIDEVLEDNAEEFVRGYVQKGGE